MILRTLFLAVLAFSTGCTLAPLSEEHTAKTLGMGNNEWAVGAGNTHAMVSYKRGVNDKLDLGVLAENQHGLGILLGLSGKYMFSDLADINPWALLFGAGIGTNTTYGYLGGIKSFRLSSSYELSLNARFNVINWSFDDGSDADDANDFIDDLINITLDAVSGTHTYATANIANTFWFSEGTGLTLSIGGISFFGEDADVGLNGGLKLHFKY